jgi:hypothetical protein
MIPPKTTSIAKALDSYFFRQHKEIARRMYERIALDKLNINLREEQYYQNAIASYKFTVG